ncbi:hypothetical protein DICVIV_03223 [Dictyocaulus viviparus]|uniref:Uncharacterized protein n=1 Tax=Dictyocaulus viviparus TaxID=29172 RepID=A0A0D8Y7Q1_DICVI|nr:hypothetical protein DICVIV_03223 [Dictyocaulus viviparus]
MDIEVVTSTYIFTTNNLIIKTWVHYHIRFEVEANYFFFFWSIYYINALGLGAMWGTERALKLIKEAGFTDISVLPTPQFVINVLYVCRK